MLAVRRSSLSLLLFLVSTSLYAQEPPPPGQTWSGNAGAGLSLTRGNSDTKNVNLTLQIAQRIDARNLAKYDAFYLRGDSNGNLIIDRTIFGGRDEYTLSPLTYAFGDVHFIRDRFKEIDYLVTPTVGAGHHFIKEKDFDLAAEGGVGVVVEKDRGLARQTSGALSARQLLTWKFSPTASVGEIASGLWKTNDLGDALYHIEGSLASDLTARSQLKLSALDDYKTRPPAPGIKKNDIAIIAAVVMKF
jgi:putative salt-induced outer membrane protein YdiY